MRNGVCLFFCFTSPSFETPVCRSPHGGSLSRFGHARPAHLASFAHDEKIYERGLFDFLFLDDFDETLTKSITLDGRWDVYPGVPDPSDAELTRELAVTSE